MQYLLDLFVSKLTTFVCCVCFSYDTRGPHNELATHWHDGQILDERAFFRTIPEPSTLSIHEITEADEGEYRCRIDYLRSPTKNIRVKLTVIGK